MPDPSKLLSRIRALRALAADKAATPAEAAAAAAAVERIIARHQLEELHEPPPPPSEAPFVDEPFDPLVEERIFTWRSGRKVPLWQTKLVSEIAHQYQCAAFIANKEGVIYVVGRASDIALVREQYTFLRREVERLARGRGKGDGAAYRIGIVEGIVAAMRAARAETLSEADLFVLRARYMLACAAIELRHKVVARLVLEPGQRIVGVDGFAAGRDMGQRAAGERVGRRLR